uniref:Uncharacterized protein n=1 Tax=Setaria digitata TaxID=48799 RepID=A0A915PMY4_9BILA
MRGRNKNGLLEGKHYYLHALVGCRARAIQVNSQQNVTRRYLSQKTIRHRPSKASFQICYGVACPHSTIQIYQLSSISVRSFSGHVANCLNAIICIGARKRATTMHAGKEKRQSSTAVEVASTSVPEGTVVSVGADCVASSYGTVQYDKETCICWTKLLNDSAADKTQFWDCQKVACWKAQRRTSWSQTFRCCGPQSSPEVGSAVKEFENCLQSSKCLFAKKVISRSHVDSSSTSEQEEDCCYSKQRIIYQSYRDLKRISTQHCNTASPLPSIRSQNLPIHRYRYQQRSRRILYANLKLLIYWHAFSLLACFAATGLCVRATVSESLLNLNGMKHMQEDVPDLLFLQQFSKHLTSITTSATNVDHSTSTRPNPFLRYSRSTSVQLGLALDSVCYVWSSIAPHDLCKLSPWERYQFLRKLSVFSRDCLEENNIKAAQLFRLTSRLVNSEADLRIQAKFLRANAEGQACILAPAGAQQCLSCFQKVDRILKEVDKAYEKFNLTLHRFDCMLAVDTASATRPFSPNGSCTDCKIWYRKWLVVHLLDLWSVPPCLNWCYYVQLACPHLATSKVVDYAGHPSFQCRDLYIPPVSAPRDAQSSKSTSSSTASEKKSSIASKCACLHPCDLEEFQNLTDATSSAEQNRPNSYSSALLANTEEEDFFPSAQHCMVRQRVCGRMKDEDDHQVIRRSASASGAGESLRNFNSDGIAMSSYVTKIASASMRSSDSAGAVPHHHDSAVQETSINPVGYVSQWWTKHRARRRLQSDANIVTSSTVNGVTSTTVPITVSSTPSDVNTRNSGVDWRKTRWSTCSGIFIYTLFFSLLLLRRPPLL